MGSLRPQRQVQPERYAADSKSIDQLLVTVSRKPCSTLPKFVYIAG